MRIHPALSRVAPVAGLAAVLTLAGCGADTPSEAAPTRASFPVVSEGNLTACTDTPYAPFEYTENGREVGIDIELVRAIATDLGLEPVFKDIDFDTIFDEMMAGECDLVASAVSITDARRAKYAFSEPYFEVNQSLLVRAVDAGKVAGLTDLAGRRIGVQKGTTGADYAMEKATGATVVPYDDVADLLPALQQSKIDGLIQDFPINSYLARNSDTVKVASTFTDVEREQYGLVMKPDAEGMRTEVNAALQRLRDSGKYDEILRTHLGAS